MTDAELIARLHKIACHMAADRIEALIAEKKYLLERVMEQDDRTEALETKLAKAMSALEEIAGNGNAAGRNPQLMADKARTTLAEIKGETK